MESVETPKKESKIKLITKGFIKENPTFAMMLGMCPSLATTTSIEKALGMGVLVLLVLMCTNTVISLLKKVIPNDVRIPCYIVIIAGFVTIVKMFCQAYLPELYSSLGVFISLIVVNCIILGRAESFANQNTVFDSLLDAIGLGLGFTVALVFIAFFREFLGTGGIHLGETLTFIPKCGFDLFSNYSISILTQSAGGFIMMGLLLALLPKIGQAYNSFKEKRKAKKDGEAECSQH